MGYGPWTTNNLAKISKCLILDDPNLKIMDFKRVIAFLKKLKANNNKDWFEVNRKEYEAIKAEWIDYVDVLIKGIGAFDPEILKLDPRKCIFRINRDVRFSADKSPYKTNFGASMNPGGKKSLLAGYYFHIDPSEVFIAGGVYMPTPEQLAAIRQEIDYNFKEFKAIAESKDIKKYFGKISGDALARPPKGYTEDNPAIGYLKQKSFLMVQKIPVKDLYEKDFEKKLFAAFKAMKPLNDFVNRIS